MLFRALSEQPRRRCLFYLLENPTPTVGELADVLAGWRSTTEGVVGPDERDRIAVGLRHVHLPMLASTELVDFDKDSATVSLRSLPEDVEELVAATQVLERNRSEPRTEGP